MPDRNDPSQHAMITAAAAAAYPAQSFETGNTFNGGLADEVQYTPPRLYVDALDEPEFETVLDQHLDKYFNAYQRELRLVAKAVQLGNGGGALPSVGIGELAGILLNEYTGTGPIVFTLYDGPDSTGLLIYSQRLTALQSTGMVLFPDGGLHYDRGLSYTITAGANNATPGSLNGVLYQYIVRPI